MELRFRVARLDVKASGGALGNMLRFNDSNWLATFKNIVGNFVVFCTVIGASKGISLNWSAKLLLIASNWLQT